MTITIKPVHLVVVLAFVLGIGTALVVSGSGGDDKTATLPTATPTEERFADIAPTETPVPPPLPTEEPPPPPPPPTEEPLPPPTAVPQLPREGAPSAPPPAPATPVPPPPPPPPQGPTLDEQRYRNQATAQLFALITQLRQYHVPTRGVFNDILDIGGIARNFANQMTAFQPVPARFQRAHTQLQQAMTLFANHCTTVTMIPNAAAVEPWYDRYLVLYDLVGLALEDYQLVVGIQFPPIPR
jgi:hypothetical protein